MYHFSVNANRSESHGTLPLSFSSKIGNQLVEIDGRRRFSQDECLFLAWQLLEPVAVDVSVLLQHMHVCLKIDYYNGKLKVQ